MFETIKAKLASAWAWLKAKLAAAVRSLTVWVQAAAVALWSYIAGLFEDPGILTDTGLQNLVAQIDVKVAAKIGLTIAVLTILARLRRRAQ